MFPVVSLVIPVYNSGKYLAQALDSVVRQTFQNFEVVIVNDGSTDNSELIAQSFCIKYSNFRIINQKNSGPASAKNTGIKNSRGKFLTFLDSDDLLDSKFLEVLYNLIKENDSDISYCNFNLYHAESNISICMPFTAKSGVYQKDDAFAKLISDVTLHHFPWNKMYKKDLFIKNNIKFHDMFYEDVATCPELFYYANRVAVTSKPLYYYRRHQKSIIAVMDSCKINDFVKSLGIIRNFLETKNEFKKYRKRFIRYAKRIKLQVYYCILADYIRNGTVSDMYKNFKNASDSIDYFVSDSFEVTDGEVVVPYSVYIPKKLNLES